MIEGNSQFVIERSTLQQEEINLGAITGVRIKIVCNGKRNGHRQGYGSQACTCFCRGNPGWQVSTVDFDNWNGILRKPNPLNGNIASTPLLNQGIMWRSDLLPGFQDSHCIISAKLSAIAAKAGSLLFSLDSRRLEYWLTRCVQLLCNISSSRSLNLHYLGHKESLSFGVPVKYSGYRELSMCHRFVRKLAPSQVAMRQIDGRG